MQNCVPTGIIFSLKFLCRLRSIATHRDHFVRRLSVRLSVRLSYSQSYVSQGTHAFLGMLPLFLFYMYVSFSENKKKITFIIQVILAVVASLWSVMTLGMGTKTEKKEEEFHETLLANQSLLFLLVLTNHCTSEYGLNNPYRQALFSFTNSQGTCMFIVNMLLQLAHVMAFVMT